MNANIYRSVMLATPDARVYHRRAGERAEPIAGFNVLVDSAGRLDRPYVGINLAANGASSLGHKHRSDTRHGRAFPDASRSAASIHSATR